MCIKIKSKLSYLRIVLFLTGFVFVGCANERTENGYDLQTGVHKIVIRQSGDTDSFELHVSIGGADKGGPPNYTITRMNTLVIPTPPK